MVAPGSGDLPLRKFRTSGVALGITCGRDARQTKRAEDHRWPTRSGSRSELVMLCRHPGYREGGCRNPDQCPCCLIQSYMRLTKRVGSGVSLGGLKVKERLEEVQCYEWSEAFRPKGINKGAQAEGRITPTDAAPRGGSLPQGFNAVPIQAKSILR